MFMHLKAKRIAMMSIFAALSVILLFLGEVISINTLFFIAAAAFLVGMIQIEYGSRPGILFFFVCLALSLLLLPNKMHCITYFVFGFNIWFWHAVISFFGGTEPTRSKTVMQYIVRLIVFNLTYIPIVIFLPKLIIEGEITTRLIAIAIVLGQAGYFLLCYAFGRFVVEIWSKYAGKLMR